MIRLFSSGMILATLIGLIKRSVSKSPVEVDLSRFSMKYTLNGRIEGLSMIEKILLNFEMNYTMISDFEYSDEDSKYGACSEGPLIRYNSLTTEFDKSLLCIDEINFGKTPISQFHFYSVKHRNVRYKDNFLGISPIFNDKMFSPLHILYNNKKINQLSLGLSFSKKKAYFGGFPKNITAGRLQGKCSRDLSVNIWSCFVNGIEVEGSNFAINSFVQFRNIKETFVTREFFDFLIEKVFKELIQKGKCEKSFISREISIRCAIETVNELRNITFIIDSTNYSISLTKFFDCFKFFCYSTIVFDGVIGDNFVIGTSFLNVFDVLFDFEENQIAFYLDSPSLGGRFKGNEKVRPKADMLLLCLVLLSGIVLEVVIILKIK